MTIICYKDGILAADDLITEDNVLGILSSRAIKIAWRKKDGALIGGAGALADIASFIDLALVGKEKKWSPTFGHATSCCIITPDGVITEYQGGGSYELRSDFYVNGSGGPTARGALLAGANPAEAAHMACTQHGWAQADIHVADHQGNFRVVSSPFGGLHDNSRADANALKLRSTPKRSPRKKAAVQRNPRSRRSLSRRKSK